MQKYIRRIYHKKDIVPGPCPCNADESALCLRFVTGERSLDEFDAFLADMESMGLSRMTELKQAAYDRYLENQ